MAHCKVVCWSCLEKHHDKCDPRRGFTTTDWIGRTKPLRCDCPARHAKAVPK